MTIPVLITPMLPDGSHGQTRVLNATSIQFLPPEDEGAALPVGPVSFTFKFKTNRRAVRHFFGLAFARRDRLRWQLKRKGRPGWKS